MPKSINAVVSLLGAMRTGAAYVPIDFAAPAERNRFIARNCAVRAVCVDEPRADIYQYENGPEPQRKELRPIPVRLDCC